VRLPIVASPNIISVSLNVIAFPNIIASLNIICVSLKADLCFMRLLLLIIPG
jgi:hypothetical protein